MQNETTSIGLQERQNAPLILPASVEPFNIKNSEDYSESFNLQNHYSMPDTLVGSGYNLNESSARMSGRIFVLSYK